MIITVIVVTSFYVAKRKSRCRDFEEAEFLHCEKDSPMKRGELL